MLHILQDQAIKDLKGRIERAECCYKPSMIMLAAYDAKNPQRQHVRIYSNKSELEEKLEEDRANFNGRIVLHEFGSGEYECLTDIADKEPEEMKGRWLLRGVINGKLQTHRFPSKDLLLKRREDIFAQCKDFAIVHEIGTTTYTIVNTTRFPYAPPPDLEVL
jgi:hypothetical protein